LLAFLGAHHIIHVSTIRVKSHLSALLGAHNIFHVGRIRVKLCATSVLSVTVYPGEICLVPFEWEVGYATESLICEKED